MAPRARTLVLPLAAATVLVASTIFLFAAAGARWRPADTGLPVPAAAAAFSVVPVSVNSSTNGQELSFVDENGRPDDPNAISAAGRCDPRAANIRVFMYDMPPEFHFGLLGWVPPAGEASGVWPDVRSGAAPHYPGGLNQQHSVEYWLTLDLLSSSSAPCGAAVRVADSRDADIVFVPFFASLSYNRHSKAAPPEKVSRDRALQEKLVRYLMAQQEWKRSGGTDHVIVAHHPNSLLHARSALFPAVFVLSDFGRYDPRVASLEKDVIAPYRHMAKTFVNDSAGFGHRPTLLYFRGAIYSSHSHRAWSATLMASLPPSEPAGAAGLEGLEGLVLDTVIAKAGARPAAALSCASTRLRAAVAEDAIWRRFCAEDLGLDAPLDPEDRPLPSFKDAYKVWLESFGMYPLPLVKRVKNFWSSLKSWLSENFPEALKTLSKGVSEVQIESAEDNLGFKLPMPTKLLYRFCNGQLPFTEKHYENVRMAPLGIIGGYLFYDHFVNVHLSPLEQIVEETKEFYHEFNEQGVFNGSKLIIVATSWYRPKTFLLNCSNGELYVGTVNLPDGEMMLCVPKSLIRPTNNDMPQDGLLLWLEEHLRRLQKGMIKTRMLKTLRYISLYPEAPASCTSVMTNGVKVRASAVFVPEHPESGGPGARNMYSYSIRLSVPEACMLGGMYYSSCQLYSRHWIIRWRGMVVSDVRGEGVIGEYPLLLPGQEEFVYESCTPMPGSPGSVEGSFTFVPGRLSRPEGKPFEVTVAPFPLETPEYIF